ncbi:MAG: hypothetical protein Q9190_002569 [Brigantiaea leucoxantha]
MIYHKTKRFGTDQQFTGRSLSACRRAYDRLLARSAQLYQTQYAQPPLQASPPTQNKKRPAPSSEVSPAVNREIQPRAQGFVTVNEPIETTAYPPSLADPGEQPRKKRGRPSKAEVEMKAAEAAARGELYPQPRKLKTSKPTESTGNTAIMFTPVSTGQSDIPGSSSSRKRQTKPKAKKEAGPGGSGLEATAETASQPLQEPETFSTTFGSVIRPSEGGTVSSPPAGPQQAVQGDMPQQQYQSLYQEEQPIREEVTESHGAPSEVAPQYTRQPGPEILESIMPQQQQHSASEQQPPENTQQSSGATN